jgi:Fe-S oxidoreductase
MTDEKNKKIHKRDDALQPAALPGIRRFQFFSDLRDRALTTNLNRLAMLGIGASLALDVAKPLAGGAPQTIYCYECRACYATQDKCPAGIAYQAELNVATRVGDPWRFLRAGGMKCVRCGGCVSFCVINLDLPRIFAVGQEQTMKAIEAGRVPRARLVEALRQGWFGREHIDRVAAWLQQAERRGGRQA